MGYKQTAVHRPGRSSYHQVGLVRGQFGDVDYDEWIDFIDSNNFFNDISNEKELKILNNILIASQDKKLIDFAKKKIELISNE